MLLAKKFLNFMHEFKSAILVSFFCHLKICTGSVYVIHTYMLNFPYCFIGCITGATSLNNISIDKCFNQIVIDVLLMTNVMSLTQGICNILNQGFINLLICFCGYSIYKRITSNAGRWHSFEDVTVKNNETLHS